MELKKLPYELSVCRLGNVGCADLSRGFYFIGKTDDEISLVCKTEDVPADTAAREDGWRGFYVSGTLDFSLVGILSRLSSVLADAGIGIFAVSTYNTDYILVKEKNFERALEELCKAGYTVTG